MLSLSFHDQLLGHGLPTGVTTEADHSVLCVLPVLTLIPHSPPLQIFLAYTVEGSSFVFGDALVQNVFAFQVIPVCVQECQCQLKGEGKAEADTCVHEVR